MMTLTWNETINCFHIFRFLFKKYYFIYVNLIRVCVCAYTDCRQLIKIRQENFRFNLYIPYRNKVK